MLPSSSPSTSGIGLECLSSPRSRATASSDTILARRASCSAAIRCANVILPRERGRDDALDDGRELARETERLGSSSSGNSENCSSRERRFSCSAASIAFFLAFCSSSRSRAETVRSGSHKFTCGPDTLSWRSLRSSFFRSAKFSVLLVFAVNSELRDPREIALPAVLERTLALEGERIRLKYALGCGKLSEIFTGELWYKSSK